MAELARTPLHDRHVAAGAKLVPFAGWEMPLHYGSQLGEHEAVRRSSGLFDVSHMTVTDVEGEAARELLRRLLANDVAKLDGQDGRALYTCLLNEAGGVIDDLIVYRRGAERYRLVSNAATRQRVRDWLASHAAQAPGATVRPEQEAAMIAIQGPGAAEVLEAATGRRLAETLSPFHAVEAEGSLIGRTGYTGEDGFEVILPGERAGGLWDALVERGAQPCGLGARDTLRLEAGLNLYGQDMDETVTPLESGLAWTVAWEPPERPFVGRDALEALRAAGPARRLAGLVVEGRAIPRSGARVTCEDGEGMVTSGGFGPTLGGPVALARLPAGAAARCEVEVRGRWLPARVVRPPFVRHGQVRV